MPTSPFGNVPGDTVIAAHIRMLVNIRLPVQPFESVAVIVKLNTPAEVGVPEMVPSDANDNPAGNDPVRLNVYGATPPLAVIVWRYG